MKQIICDICGNVIKGKYLSINLPSMYGGEIVLSRDDMAHDLCKPCALELYNLIQEFKNSKKERS